MTNGTKVTCNGYEGTIVKMHDGQLEGMADVRLSSGVVCVDIYQLTASNGKPIRMATKVVLADGTEIKFMERMSKREALRQVRAL